MKLLYLANLRLPTEKAYGIQIAKMCEAFALAGNDVTLAYPFRDNHVKDDFFEFYSVKRNFKTKEVFAFDFYLPGKFDNLAVLIKEFFSALSLLIYAKRNDFDLAVSRDELPVLLLSSAKKNIVFEAHKFSKRKKFFYRHFLKKGVKVITISQGLKDEFKNLGFSDENILVAHDGVDVGGFDLKISQEEARRNMGLPSDKKIVLYTGHLFGWKGADLLAEAAKLVPECLFVFVGGTDKDINIFRKKYGDRKNILIVGRKPHAEIPMYLKSADVLILPKSEDRFGSPLKMFEYMASGRPILAAKVPSFEEVLNKDNSVLIEADDPKVLAKEISFLIYDNDRSQRLAQKSLEDVKEYTWQKRAEKIFNFVK